MENTFLMWGLGLFALAGLLVFLEVLVPSGGIIGAASVIAAIAGVVAFFRESVTAGLVSILVLIVLGPVVIAFALKIWPNTPIGRRLILDREDDERDAPEEIERKQKDIAHRSELLDQTGIATTDLIPGGKVKVGEEYLDAIAAAGAIDKGTPIRVIGFDGAQVKVRKA
ncbi:MAG: NfeD family protein [Planctomycetota bacterium]|jgi:membrane-bound ClpP family serine protease